MAHLNIVKLEPDGFTCRVMIKKKLEKEKEFHMASSSGKERHVVYVKQGERRGGVERPDPPAGHSADAGFERSSSSALWPLRSLCSRQTAPRVQQAISASPSSPRTSRSPPSPPPRPRWDPTRCAGSRWRLPRPHALAHRVASL